MKKLLLLFVLLFIPSIASAQCNGVFPASNVCGTNSIGPNTPGPLPLSSFALSPGGVSGDVQTNNGSGGLAGVPAGQLTLTPTGGTVARSFSNLFGNFLTVKDFGAVGDGSTSDQTAFQAMIDASCPGHLAVIPPAAAVNQIFPILIPASANPYIVTQLNATNCAGFTMWGMGSGAVQPVIKYTVASPANTIIDMTGSGAGFNLKNFGVLGPISDGVSATYPNIGLLLAVTSAGGGNYGEIDNVNVGGRFQQTAVLIYGVCCSSATMFGANNYNQNNPNAYALYLTGNNATSIGPGIPSSIYTTIASGFQGGSDWHFNRSEVHAFTGSGTTSAQSVFFDNVTTITWTGGQIAACTNGGFLMRTNGNVANASFRGTTFYCDRGTNAAVLLGASSGSVTHLTLQNILVNLETSGTIFSGQSPTSGYILSGTVDRGGVTTQYDINPLGSSAGSFGAAVN